MYRGGGITYFVMPAIVDSLILNQGLSAHVAWRVSFIVPFILITTTAIGMLILCPDTPTGKWSERHLVVQQNLQSHGVHAVGGLVDIPGSITDRKQETLPTSTDYSNEKRLEEESEIAKAKHSSFNNEATLPEAEMLAIARGEVIQKPSFKEALHVIFTLQTAMVAFSYFCSFGAELAINSVLGSYYLKNFPSLGETGTGRWAAMFGLLNVVFRPAGGWDGGSNRWVLDRDRAFELQG
jgi:NNP family nitrate/nitrite transporter-like MFS transporter